MCSCLGNPPACALPGTGFAALSQVRNWVGKHQCRAFNPGAEIIKSGCLVGFISLQQVRACFPGSASAPISLASLTELWDLGGISTHWTPFPTKSLWLRLQPCGRKLHPELLQVIIGFFFFFLRCVLVFSSTHSRFLNKRLRATALREVLWRNLCFVLESKEVLPVTSFCCTAFISLAPHRSGGLFGLNSRFSYLGNTTNLPGIRGNAVAKCVC